MLSKFKTLIPRNLINLYHGLGGRIANFYFGRPTKNITVIGVTGTKGKSTTCHMISHILEKTGNKVGMISTPIIKIGRTEKLNTTKMTMLGGFKAQKLLKLMVNSGCKYVVIETSSQGLEQNRHWGIKYSAAVLTNIFPEHIEAHGNFENYIKSKLKLWESFKNGISVLNKDADRVENFIKKSDEDRIIFYSPLSKEIWAKAEDRQTININLGIFGEFNNANALAAIALAYAFGIDIKTAGQALEDFKGTPGRAEIIDEGQSFRVIVDYAHEPKSLKTIYEELNRNKAGKIISVLGSAGGGRDKWRRPELGKLAAEYADIAIITNEDPYDEDPQKIIEEVAQGAIKNGKKLGENLFKILDRKEAIRKAIDLARNNDTVILTGKGAEQWIMGPGGLKIQWDEREIVHQFLSGK